jgi:hypothetical protein
MELLKEWRDYVDADHVFTKNKMNFGFVKQSKMLRL